MTGCERGHTQAQNSSAHQAWPVVHLDHSGILHLSLLAYRAYLASDEKCMADMN